MNSTEIIIPFRIKFGPFKNRSRSFSFSHFFKKENWTNLTISWKLLMYFTQKLEDKLTLKSSWNKQKYFFLTFNMKKCHVIFLVGNFFSKINEINTYVTKCGMFIGKCKTSFDNSNIMWTNPASNYMFKVSNRNTITRSEICFKLTIKIPERCQWGHSGIFIVNFEHTLHLVLVLLWLNLSR